MNVRILGFCSALCLAIVATDAKADFITNGGFETPPIAPAPFSTFGVGSTGITGWTVISGTNDAGGGSVDLINGYQPAHSGAQAVDLDGTRSPSSSVSAGGISQTLNGLTLGQTYVVDFFYTNNYFAPFASANVTIDGTTLASITHAGATQTSTAYTEGTYRFTANATSEALSFISTDAAASQSGIIIDDVSVNAASAAVPEPASLVMLGLGLAAAGTLTRFGRRTA